MQTPEDLIDIFETAASRCGAPDAGAFSLRVRHDLALYRHGVPKEPPPEPMEPGPQGELVKYPHPQPAFSVPSKYADMAENWLVFSAFVECFLDPTAYSVGALNSLGELTREKGLDRVIFQPNDLDHVAADEMEMDDLQRIRGDYKEMIALASELGAGVFGKVFSISDFIRGQEKHD